MRRVTVQGERERYCRYYVNRDSLFSFHRASESFLQQLVSIYVSAHYKNQPNDLQVGVSPLSHPFFFLQMLSDAPAHHLFVLMAPLSPDQTTLPQVSPTLPSYSNLSSPGSRCHSSVPRRSSPLVNSNPVSREWEESSWRSRSVDNLSAVSRLSRTLSFG